MSAPSKTGPDVYVVLDAAERELVRVADFWAAALHYRRAQRLEQYEVLVPEDDGSGFVLLIQGVGEPKAGKNRMHLDLHVDDPHAEVERLVGLGATRVGPGELGAIRWTTMLDPVGNEFCVGRR